MKSALTLTILAALAVPFFAVESRAAEPVACYELRQAVNVAHQNVVAATMAVNNIHELCMGGSQAVQRECVRSIRAEYAQMEANLKSVMEMEKAQGCVTKFAP